MSSDAGDAGAEAPTDVATTAAVAVEIEKPQPPRVWTKIFRVENIWAKFFRVENFREKICSETSQLHV